MLGSMFGYGGQGGIYGASAASAALYPDVHLKNILIYSTILAFLSLIVDLILLPIGIEIG